MDKLNLFDLYAKITLDTSEYENDMEGAKGKSSSFFDLLKANLTSQAIIGGMKTLAGAAKSMGEAALGSYAEYEQLVGGVDTLFKESSDKLQQYAANAYKDAGMSANDYMSNATSFAAALISSLEGDTDAAVEAANRAMVSMSDNANKMGTNMDSIVQTYQSLSRGNFAMLDNLKLGYGGTKAELERLIADAATYTDAQKELGVTVDSTSTSFDNIVNAIAVVQEEMGIGGATADEAATTIEGSVASMKAAWANLVTGFGNEEANLDSLLQQFVDSVGVAAGNVIPRIGVIAESFVSLAADNAPRLLEAGRNLLEKLGDGITQAIPFVTEKVPEIITQFLEWWTEQYPEIVQKGADILEQLAFGIIEAIPKLVAKLPDIIKGISTFFTSNFPKIIGIGAELLGNLLVGIVGAVPEIALQLPAVIMAIVDALKAGWQAIKEAGMYLLEGLWAGIADKVEWLKGKVTGVVDTIKGWFTGPEGFDEHSPSRWAKTVGEYMMEGLAIGMENSKGEVMETASDIVDEVKTRFNGLVDALTLQQDLGDLEYELWEKTYGQAATEAEKYDQKLKILNAQETMQAGVVETAYNAYLAMSEQYGENSAESLNYQKILLQEGIQYQELLADIEAVIAAKEQLASGISVGAVDMANSTVGVASAAMINSAAQNQDTGSADRPLNIKLVTSDNRVMADWLMPALRYVDKSNPEVVSDAL